MFCCKLCKLRYSFYRLLKKYFRCFYDSQMVETKTQYLQSLLWTNSYPPTHTHRLILYIETCRGMFLFLIFIQNKHWRNRGGSNMYLQSCFKTKYWENLFFFQRTFQFLFLKNIIVHCIGKFS